VVGAAIIISLGVSPLLPYNYCSIPFRSVPTLLLHLFLPPQEAKLLACASLVIFSYYPSGLRGSFIMSSLYLAIVHSYCPSGFRGSFILSLLYVIIRIICKVTLSSFSLLACFYPLCPHLVISTKQGNSIKSQYQMLKLRIL